MHGNKANAQKNGNMISIFNSLVRTGRLAWTKMFQMHNKAGSGVNSEITGKAIVTHLAEGLTECHKYVVG